MAPIKSVSNITSKNSNTSLLGLLSDYTRYDEPLVHRFKTAIIPSSRIPSKVKALSDTRKFAMSAANSSSQCLGVVVRSGWKASHTPGMSEISINNVSSIVQIFKLSIQALRDTPSSSTDVERVVSSFIGKVVALELFQVALDLLKDAKPYITALYHESNTLPTQSKQIIAKQTNFNLVQYCALLSYPKPPPRDSEIVLLICTSVVQSIVSLTAMLLTLPASPAVPISTLVTALEDSVLLLWITSCCEEQRDGLLARAHKATAFVLGNVQASSDVVLKLRAWTLRCLLQKPSLDTEMFWLQAARHLVTHGKSLHTIGSFDKAASDVMMFFDSIIESAQIRENSKTFMSGSTYVKFCEAALIFAQKGSNLVNVKRIENFMKGDMESSGSPEIIESLHTALFGHALRSLEQSSEPSAETLSDLHQCCITLSNDLTVFLDVHGNPRFIPSVEKLRRLCALFLEEKKGNEQLQEAIMTYCDAFVKGVEILKQKSHGSLVTRVYTYAVDSLCSLSKARFVPGQPQTYTATYEYLCRATAFIDFSLLSEGGSLDYYVKVVKYVSGTLMNIAVALYQINNYSHAIRFLVLCCDLTSQLWYPLAASASVTAIKSTEECCVYFKAALTKRWELLGDCYSKIGDRKPAYQAFLNALKFSSLDELSNSPETLIPEQIFRQVLFKRTANLVERITYIAAFDLCLKEETSLRSAFSQEVSVETLGLLLEYQINVLEKGITKPEVRSIIDGILKDVLSLYGDQFPIRRTRILVWQMDLSYRLDDGNFSVNNVVLEILSLLSPSTSPGADQGLTQFRKQYEAMMYMWQGLIIHQRSNFPDRVTSIVMENATKSAAILQEMFLGHRTQSTPERSKTSQIPPITVATKVPKMATRSSPRKKATVAKAPPITPRSQKRVFTTSPRPTKLSSPKAKTDSVATFPTDPRLISIIDTFARLLGLLGLVPLRIRFLAILQQTAAVSLQSAANEFLYASADAATEYAKAGKNKRASAIFIHTLSAINSAKSGVVSETTHILVLLSYAEILALRGRTGKSVQLYEEARSLFREIEHNPSHSSALERIKSRAQIIELAAKAAKVYALINVDKHNFHTAMSALRHSLKLWNRAYEMLLRQQNVKEPNTKEPDSNPFDMGTLMATLPHVATESETEKKAFRRNPLIECVHWRVAEGLFGALLDLADAYFLQGSIRECEYLVKEARSLATAINSTSFVCRAITRMIEIHLHRGKLEDAVSSIDTAIELLGDSDNLDAVNITRLSARYQQLLNQDSQATLLYSKALVLISDLSQSLNAWEHILPRRSSIGVSDSSSEADLFAPDLLATIFAQQLWLRRNEPRNVLSEIIQMLDTLPSSVQVESEKAAILAKVALHHAYVKFRTDIFLSSLPESTIAIPMGLISHDGKVNCVRARGINETLSTAQTHFQQALQRARDGGKVTYVREATLSLTILQLFQAALGYSDCNDANIAVGLLNASMALTLRRELIEAVESKFPIVPKDDLTWSSLSGDDDDESTAAPEKDNEGEDTILRRYWEKLGSRYRCGHDFNDNYCTDVLPDNWTVVTIGIADDNNTIFVSRQRAKSQPLIFCIPIGRQGRKENEDEYFTLEDGTKKLEEILTESDRIAKAAKDVASNDRNGRITWWAKRMALDKQLVDLLNNIEYCWLGAFKTVLHETKEIRTEELKEIADRIEIVFQRALASEKKHIAQLKLNLNLVECFAFLSPQCRHEELEDIIYFILDLFQFHGISISLSEIDIDQIAVQLRTVLEDCAIKAFPRVKDEHLFLVLDKNIQGIPWESIPYLRGRSISRIPSLSFLFDRIEFVKVQGRLGNLPQSTIKTGGAIVNPRSTCLILNPSGDLEKSQARFEPWLREMTDSSVGWEGIIGRKPSELELIDALQKKDLVIYIGHGGAEQYARSNKIKHLPRCAATMLWGCSSGLMHDMGDFDRHGTPYNYMIAGCSTLIACLWDVTDNELDRFSQSVFDKLQMNAERVKNWQGKGSVSVVTAVAESRDSCKLKYLTGAAPVVYGLPFYL